MRYKRKATIRAAEIQNRGLPKINEKEPNETFILAIKLVLNI